MPQIIQFWLEHVGYSVCYLHFGLSGGEGDKKRHPGVQRGFHGSRAGLILPLRRSRACFKTAISPHFPQNIKMIYTQHKPFSLSMSLFYKEENQTN